VAVQKFFLCGLELLRALFDLGLQVLCELVDLAERRPQAVAHPVEGAGQLVEFLTAAYDVQRLVEFHLADRLGAFDQLVDGPAEEAAGEIDDKQADQRDFHRGHQQDAELHGCYFVVHAFEVEPQVQDAEHLHLRRMGVALRLAARGLVVDGCGHGQAASAVRAAKNADARRQVGMTAFRWCLPGAGLILRIGREHHLAGAIEHADTVDALFEGDGLHYLVGGLAMVVQHSEPSRTRDGLGQLVRTKEYCVQELLLLGGDIDESGNRRHNDHDDGDREHQLPGETPRHNGYSDLEVYCSWWQLCVGQNSTLVAELPARTHVNMHQ